MWHTASPDVMSAAAAAAASKQRNWLLRIAGLLHLFETGLRVVAEDLSEEDVPESLLKINRATLLAAAEVARFGMVLPAKLQEWRESGVLLPGGKTRQRSGPAVPLAGLPAALAAGAAAAGQPAPSTTARGRAPDTLEALERDLAIRVLNEMLKQNVSMLMGGGDLLGNFANLTKRYKNLKGPTTARTSLNCLVQECWGEARSGAVLLYVKDKDKYKTDADKWSMVLLPASTDPEGRKLVSIGVLCTRCSR